VACAVSAIYGGGVVDDARLENFALYLPGRGVFHEAAMAVPHEIVITTDRSVFDMDLIHRFLANSYWAKNIPRSLVVKSIENALCFGMFLEGRQIGFARLITDRATFAYLADVFVVEEYRGRGFGGDLLRWILDYPEVKGLRRILLATKDAQAIYRKFGFTELANVGEFMTIHRPGIYLHNNTPLD
jgi:GNAT superfamily N-acetyltransferase